MPGRARHDSYFLIADFGLKALHTASSVSR
jgi:hypothetical protein